MKLNLKQWKWNNLAGPVPGIMTTITVIKSVPGYIPDKEGPGKPGLLIYFFGGVGGGLLPLGGFPRLVLPPLPPFGPAGLPPGLGEGEALGRSLRRLFSGPALGCLAGSIGGGGAFFSASAFCWLILFAANVFAASWASLKPCVPSAFWLFLF